MVIEKQHILDMERYSSFKELKEQTNSGSSNNGISKTTENKIKSFIELLRASVIHSPKATEKPSATNSQDNAAKHGR